MFLAVIDLLDLREFCYRSVAANYGKAASNHTSGAGCQGRTPGQGFGPLLFANEQ